MEGVRVEDFVPCTSSLHGVAFINIKFHLPGEFPLAIELRSYCKSVESCWVLMLRYRMQSSAKRRIVLLLASSGRSLMYIKNSMGPRTVPWGTPERTGWEEDCVPSETTLCDLPCKNV